MTIKRIIDILLQRIHFGEHEQFPERPSLPFNMHEKTSGVEKSVPLRHVVRYTTIRCVAFRGIGPMIRWNWILFMRWIFVREEWRSGVPKSDIVIGHQIKHTYTHFAHRQPHCFQYGINNSIRIKQTYCHIFLVAAGICVKVEYLYFEFEIRLILNGIKSVMEQLPQSLLYVCKRSHIWILQTTLKCS